MRAVAGRAWDAPTSHRGLCGWYEAAWHAVAVLVDGPRVRVEVLDIIGRTLCLGGRVHQHGRIVAQDLHPALEVAHAVVEGGVGNAATPQR